MSRTLRGWTTSALACWNLGGSLNVIGVAVPGGVEVRTISSGLGDAWPVGGARVPAWSGVKAMREMVPVKSGATVTWSAWCPLLEARVYQ